MGTPCVVFLDDFSWIGFNQFSTQLHKEGIRTIRVNANIVAWAPHSSRMLYEHTSARLVYDRFETLQGAHDVQGLREILSSENVIDIQFVETLGDLVLSAIDVVDPDLKASLQQRVALTDKLRAAEFFKEAGVRTPRTIPLDQCSPEEAVKALGLPLVVKECIGSGGSTVAIVDDLDQLHLEVNSRAATRSTSYYEQYVAGTKLNYGAVYGLNGIEQELLYKVTNWVQPVGTATTIETIEDEQLAEFARQAVIVSGCTGVMNMDILRDHEGTDWLIDFNPRVFGGCTNFLLLGINVAHGYLRSKGVRHAASGQLRAKGGITLRVFPASLTEQSSTGSYERTLIGYIKESGPYLRRLGLRYWLFEMMSVMTKVSSSRRSRKNTSPTSPADNTSTGRYLPTHLS